MRVCVSTTLTCVLVSFFLVVSLFAEDSIILNSGEVVQGRVISETETQIEVEVAHANRTIFTTRTILKTEIKTMGRETPEQKAEQSAYGALVKYKLDPNQEFSADYYSQGIAAFEGFIDLYPHSTFVSDVHQQATIWQGEKTQVLKGLVKVGNQWMSPAEKRPKYELKLASQRVSQTKQRLTSLESLRETISNAMMTDKSQVESFRKAYADADRKVAETELRSYDAQGRLISATPNPHFIYAVQAAAERTKAGQDMSFAEGQVKKAEADLSGLEGKIATARSELESAQRDYGNLQRRQSEVVNQATSGAQSGASGVPGGEIYALNCDKEVQERIASSQEQYTIELASLEEIFQGRGELENLLAARSEKQRFDRLKSLENRDMVHEPQLLRALQDKYRGIFDKTTRDAVKDYLHTLEEAKRKLTIDGKLDDAISVKMQIDGIKKKYSIATE
jgi:hypothetical protein